MVNFVNMKAVIFDMDGVIFDTERAVVECWQIVAARHDIKGIEEHCRECMGLNVPATKERFLKRYGADAPYDDLRAERKAIMMERFDQGLIATKSGAKALLTYLNEYGIPVALASSTSEAVVRDELTKAGLISHFDEIVCGDMVKNSKPDPEIFLLAASKLGVKPEDAIVIEDSYNGVRAGVAAGCYVIMVPDMIEPDDEMRAITSEISKSLDAVLEEIKEGKLL